MNEVTREEFDQLVETVEKLALSVMALTDVTGGNSGRVWDVCFEARLGLLEFTESDV